ncbi:MAG: carboxypeptidase-like regulatory domain-containing protein [Bacteroidales bacterium]|nr:carboxypeptidase-like regulatory domain-containing protein [Bacteroidales bacterium]
MKNTFKIILSLAFVASISLSSMASEKGKSETNSTMVTASMEGTVFDADTKETLAGVTVKIAGTNTEVKTDLDGNFSIEGLIPGNYNLEVSYISYKEAKLVKTVALNTANEVTLKLKSE